MYAFQIRVITVNGLTVYRLVCSYSEGVCGIGSKSCFFSGVVSLLSSQNHISFRRSFSCNRQNKKPMHRSIKNRRELYSRFKMMFCVSALKFKDGTVCLSVHSLTVPKSIECRQRYFLLAYRRH